MSEFATVLRAWRDRVTPEQVGMPAGPGRRTSGLRREELAALAGVSVDYIVRLEQGRATNPSAQTITALARALRLDSEERDHLLRIAGAPIPSARVAPQHIPPGVMRIVDRMGDSPVAVMTAAWDIVHWNPLWAALFGDPSAHSVNERNVAWRYFTQGPGDVEFAEGHSEEFTSDLSADLRRAAGLYPDDARIAGLVAALLRTSPLFAEAWETATVASHTSSRKTVHSPVVGPIELDCDVLSTPSTDMRIVVYTAVPGSESAEKLQLLRVTGTQEFARGR
ncbi:XRE family transcriptional regulator [Labedella populi]|uniref:XRE family transcriptional regulator n=1 Tax=Labedella populi TaxID=2498850 RepID=A0A444QE14_9MICO|nr:helix-turn-helix transcriptional regulator [Labedella populi]RWZ67774.1 XRE family transcriptional regulator [Labedella populi]